MTADQLDAWFDELRAKLIRNETINLPDANLLRLQLDQIAQLARTTRKRESIRRDAFQLSMAARGHTNFQRNAETGAYVDCRLWQLWRDFK